MKSSFSERNQQAVLRENSMFLSSFHENNRNVSVAHCQEPKCSWIIWISEAKKIKIKFKLNYLHSSPELVVLLFRRRNANRKSDNHVWRWWANFSSQNQIIKSLCFGFAYKIKPKYWKRAFVLKLFCLNLLPAENTQTPEITSVSKVFKYLKKNMFLSDAGGWTQHCSSSFHCLFPFYSFFLLFFHRRPKILAKIRQKFHSVFLHTVI